MADVPEVKSEELSQGNNVPEETPIEKDASEETASNDNVKSVCT